MHNCPDCKKDGSSKKYDELSSRVSSMNWHIQDYEKIKGKGSFKRTHPDTYALFDEALNQKSKLLGAHMKHEIYEEDEHDESKPHVDQVKNVPVI